VGLGEFVSKITSKSNNPGSGENTVVNSVDSGRKSIMPNVRVESGSNNGTPLIPLVDDELSTRLFSAVVGMVEDRRQIATSLEEYKRYTHDAQLSVEELKEEKKASQLILERKEQEIESVRRQVSEKQLKYDQLLEEYKQLRANDEKEYGRLQQQIKEMRLNYENLNADYSRFRTESMKETEKLEAEARDALVKYHQLVDDFNKVREENASLTTSILNFTQQMSSLRVPDHPREPARNALPIHPVVDRDQGDASRSNA